MCDLCDGLSEHDYQQRIIRNVRRYGWTVQYVLGEDSRNPSFAYTIGLSRVRHPEIILFDRPPEQAFHALRQLAWPVVTGLSFDEGDDLSDFYPPGERAELLRFPDSSTHLFAANALYRRDDEPPVPALQLLWPDPLAWLHDAAVQSGDPQ
jgi:Domain of unknown function (DUF4262)